MATFYSDIAANQKDGLNFLGGGLTTQPGQLNDPVAELGSASVTTAIYTLAGTEASGDFIYLFRVPAGTVVDPSSTIANSAALATAGGAAFPIQVGDTDTVGGTVSADVKRYSDTLDIYASITTVPTLFSAGTVLKAPASVTDDSCWITAKVGAVGGTLATGAKIIFRIKSSNSR